MKKMLFVVFSSVLMLAGCDNAADHQNAADSRNVELAPPESVTDDKEIVNYGNRVFYFHYTESKFGNKLSKMLQENPSWEVCSMVGNGAAGYGSNSGFFVVFREKPPLN